MGIAVGVELQISGILYTLLLLACMFILLRTNEADQPYVLPTYIVVVVVCSAFINLAYYLKMKKVKASLPPTSLKSGQIVIDTKFRSRKMTISSKWFVLHISVMLISALLAFVYYDSFPAELKMKFDWHDEVTRTAAKSLWMVLGPNLIQLVMIALFMFINRSILSSKQQINPDHPEQSIQRNTVFRLRWSLFNTVAAMMLVLLLSFTQLNMRFELQGSIVMLVNLLIPALIVIMAQEGRIATVRSGA
ncbi:hypothetical protein [Paenibacillus sp.]|uniref:hypothetical protein n=1 Tax=Paenibacillus sp. TaxID=58172 RepID=UPI002836CA52|nr:hypothetical protein [Paenibacillus sp.]MDR0268571.1 hypothetical protein [Paenibacillus sp.]